MTPAGLLKTLRASLESVVGDYNGSIDVTDTPGDTLDLLTRSPKKWRLLLQWEGHTGLPETYGSAKTGRIAVIVQVGKGMKRFENERSHTDTSRGIAFLDLVAKAGIHVVSLPMCNLYLQDRHAQRTPRGRGITLVHEMKARGIPVSFASDNTRDPFYAYGDMDMLEVMRQATRIGHLDHSDADWPQAYSTTPAASSGFDPPSFAPGAPADLVICAAREWTELFARPQSDRIVLRGGRAIDTTLPDYADLDHLMEPA